MERPLNRTLRRAGKFARVRIRSQPRCDCTLTETRFCVIFEQMDAVGTTSPIRDCTRTRASGYRRTPCSSLLVTRVHCRPPLTSKEATPGTSLRVLCKFSNDLKYPESEESGRLVSRHCVLITNALLGQSNRFSKRVLFRRKDRETERKRVPASPRGIVILLRVLN